MTFEKGYYWAVYVDIEGFSNIFKKDSSEAKRLIICLTNDLYKVANEYPYLSIIQFGGDGFLIHQTIQNSNDLRFPINLSIALLQSLILNGGIGRVQISYGTMSDIGGLYNESIRNQISDGRSYLKSNMGVMLINRVTGDAIINAYKLKGPKGPLLIIDKELRSNVDGLNIDYEYNFYKTIEYLQINWLTSNFEILTLFHSDFNITYLISKFEKYVADNSTQINGEWRDNALKLLPYSGLP